MTSQTYTVVRRASWAHIFCDPSLIPWSLILSSLAFFSISHVLVVSVGIKIIGEYYLHVFIVFVIVSTGTIFLCVTLRLRSLSTASIYIGLYFLLIQTGVAASYASTTANFQMVDELALAADRFLGFDWNSTMLYVDQYPLIVRGLRDVYATIWVQGTIIIPVLSMYNYHRNLNLFFYCFILSFGLTIFVSMIFPAAGVMARESLVPFHNLEFSGGTSPVPTFLALRSGSLRVMDWSRPQGLIQFPSFHAVMAVLWPYAARRTALFPFVLLLNIGLGLSALTEGGHYLVDVIAGIAVAALSIALVHGASQLRGGGSNSARPLRRPAVEYVG